MCVLIGCFCDPLSLTVAKNATVDVVVAKNVMTTFIVFGCKVREKRGKKK
jgi:hypothetical protein